MEENVWSDPQVLARLKNDYVMVALYIDERPRNFRKAKWYTPASMGK